MEHKWTVVVIASMGTLMAGIDGRIIVIGIPTIANQLHAEADQVIWISQAYLLASTVGLLFSWSALGYLWKGQALRYWISLIHNRVCYLLIVPEFFRVNHVQSRARDRSSRSHD